MHSLRNRYMLAFAILACVALAGCGAGNNSSGSSTPTAAVSSGSLTFGSQTLHTTSPAENVTLTNTGTVSLAVAAVTASGDFSQTNNCGASLPAGASCTANIRFTPTTAGNRSGTLSFADGAAKSPHVVQLYGSGVNAGTLAQSPSSISFGSVTVGQTSSQSVTITNSGGQSANISAVSTSGAGITLTGISTPLTLAPSQSLTFNVSFSPSSIGSVSGTVSLTNDSSTPNLQLPVTGTAIAPNTVHKVVLAWTPPTTSQVVGYNTYRGTTSGGPYTKVSLSPAATTSYTDQDVQAGNAYFYVVTSVAADTSESAYSNEAKAIVPTP